ncbi:MAG: hypothetical protein N5P05_004220 (plasmid) [Chroococcopsis gigantea SAG 12.99]|jgi:hypothetical protein|nr:hypothetical protein [Chroococcopsis gigantea SAG 12.99]
MFKVLLGTLVVTASVAIAAPNALACGRTLSQSDWRTGISIKDGPFSEIVCIDNGFDPVFRAVVDKNYVGNEAWLGEEGGVITFWNSGGAVTAIKYVNKTTLFWNSNRKDEIVDLKMDIRVGDKVFTAPFNSEKMRYELPLEAIQALAEASRTNASVKIRFNPSGLVNAIGEGTVRNFASLYAPLIKSVYESPVNYPTGTPSPAGETTTATPGTGNNITPNSTSTGEANKPPAKPAWMERCLKYGC